MTLVLNLVMTVRSAMFIEVGQISKAKVREKYYLWLNNTHCLSVFLFLCLVILTILRRPNCHLYQHFFAN